MPISFYEVLFVNLQLCHIDVCNVEQLLCNVGLDILSTLFLIMICYDLMCIFYISSPILVI